MSFKVSVKKNKLKIFYLSVLGIFFGIFIFIAAVNFQIKRQIPKYNINLKPISFNPAPYPNIINNYPPEISAQGAVILDKDSSVVLFEKNSNIRFSPASTTKIMTALVALEYFAPEDVLTVMRDDVEGSTLKLSKNEKMTFENLMYAMMLPSANDATVAIAQNYPGGEEAFVARMNQKAKELGLSNTHFQDPVGLMDVDDYTTPIDLARLSVIAMNNSEIAKIVSTKNKTVSNVEGKSYDLENLNVLLDLPGVNGVKTGFTEEAGQVLVTSRRVPSTNKDVIIVVMQSLDRFGDSESLMNFLDNNISYLSIHP